MKKILYYLRALNIGGAETFVCNVLEKIDTAQYHIDIVLQSDKNENVRLLELCKKKDVKIFYTLPFEKHYFKSYKQLLSIVKDNGYDVIHLHANSLINNIPILVARKAKCKFVVHSHNSNNNVGGAIGKYIHYFNRWLMNHGEVVRLSCSDKAAKWMFGSQKYQLINNGINLDTYKYNNQSRIELRKKYNIDDNILVWGHVSRFVEAKNHDFLIKCFDYYNKKNPESKLVLVGDGPLFFKIKTETNKPNIIFLGSISETSRFYSMFDLMVFPSLFEGLPFTLVEAQASGLPILASENITKLVNITGLINYLSLNKSWDEWISHIPSKLSETQRVKTSQMMKNSVFDSDTTIKQISNCYEN